MILNLVIELLDDEQVKFKTMTIFDKDKKNGNLPDWMFEEGYHAYFEVDTEKDQIEWIPAIGPAPCWIAKWSNYELRRDMIEAVFADFSAWHKEVYCHG